MKKSHKQESDLGKAAENSSRVLSATERSKPAPSKQIDVKITAAKGRPMLSRGGSGHSLTSSHSPPRTWKPSTP